jgi:alanine dehydrogenase
MPDELALRIVVVRPPPGVVIRVQRGRDELLEPSRASADALAFDFAVRVGATRADGKANLLGPYAQGRPHARFVYVSSGTLAGQADSCWTRRAKVTLADIDAGRVEQALRTPGAVLQACIQGTGRDGGPACAAVPLLDGGWRLVPPDEAPA